ncbi:MAG TPA: hypothetical protein VLW55_18650 [Burkholderiaceae bacterium]|nr:hypothetical protein [Burkholderiaceae bacterium]
MLVATLLLAACAAMPTGPSVAVMPGPNKPFDVFMQEDELCRGWAANRIGIPGHDAAAEQFLASTVTGAAIGAIVGGISGGNSGAGAGAAFGTVVGAAAGAGQSEATAGSAQRSYDIAYEQCMYAKGNVVPVHAYGRYYYYYPPPAAAIAPPPPPPPPPTPSR